MNSLGLTLPHGVVLEAFETHSDQPFTRLDFSKQIEHTRSYLSTAAQSDSTVELIKVCAHYAVTGRENTNSEARLPRRFVEMDIAEALRRFEQEMLEPQRVPSMTPQELLDLERELFGRQRQSNPPFKETQRHCECGIPILYGNRHLNCPMGGKVK